MELENFLTMVCIRPLPKNSLTRINTFARELAEGAVEEVWRPELGINRFRSGDIDEYTVFDSALEAYIEQRWQNNHPKFLVLDSMGYLYDRTLTQEAFKLLNEAESAPIFISYKRSESSAFALLIEYRLSQAGMLPFLDKQLQAGDDWHAELENKIKASDYFIILLGQKTLESEVTVKEIQWALEGNVALIPVWHNGFEYESGAWDKIPVEVDRALANTHTIRVLEENPLTYDTALEELLNRFGITP